ncbi:unnamed protein product [Brassica oleracea var. botrytis]|uniref:Uncharacterized protein n=2 Tax=Brassica TaxID=3705 RepID=A0A3P6DTD7_BRAOL|nr:unnamed protein product [Brassica napus]VDD30910.1 unnamed protein product [Brassica oleracea]
MASSCYSGHCRASSNISPWEELQTASVFVGYLGCSLPHFPFFVHRRLRISDGKKLRSWWVVGRWCRALLEDNGDTLDFRKLSIGAKASFGAVAVGSSGAVALGGERFESRVSLDSGARGRGMPPSIALPLKINHGRICHRFRTRWPVLIRWFSSSTWICFTNLGLIYMFFRSGSYFGRHMGSLLGSLLKYNAEVFQTTSRRLPGSLPDDFKEVF